MGPAWARYIKSAFKPHSKDGKTVMTESAALGWMD